MRDVVTQYFVTRTDESRSSRAEGAVESVFPHKPLPTTNTQCSAHFTHKTYHFVENSSIGKF